MNESSSLHNTLNPWRIYIFGGILAIVFFLYGFRLFSYQIIEYEQWLAQADENRTSQVNIPAQRGIIYDRNGFVLARNIPSYNVVVIPASLPDDPAEVQRIYREMSPIIDLPVSRSELNQETSPYVPCFSDHGISQIVLYGDTNAPYSPVKVKCDVSEEVARKVMEKSVDWPGVDVQIEPLRDYPTGSLTAAIIGYMGPISQANETYYRALGFDPNRDKVGYAGIEYAYQDILAGTNGVRMVERDVAGKVIRDLAEPVPPVPGSNIRLTIDTRLQTAVEAILTDQIDWWNRTLAENRMTSGAAIVMNPQTGEVLAMVSFPSYENNRLARFIPAYYYQQLIEDARAPLLNHAVGDVLPTGSVFKLVTAVGALNEGVVTTSQIIETPGILNVEERFAVGAPGRVVPFYDHNWRVGGFGRLDFIHGLAQSSNVYFYKLGGGYGSEVPEGLGICRLGTYAQAMGYGNASAYAQSLGYTINTSRDLNAEGLILGTGLPDEQNGLIPDPEYKRRSGESWTIGDTYLVSVGQGYVLSTPMEVLISGAVIAADGRLMEPTILREVVDGEGNIILPYQPQMRWDITKDPVIKVYEPEYGLRGCEDADTLERRTVEPWVVSKVQEGMRLAVTEGTLSSPGLFYQDLNVSVAGKTGTAEYCDKWAILARDGRVCDRGDWPTHAWTVAYAPYENPEIAVVVFVYNGGEGASTAGHPVQRIIRAYFQLKAYDNALSAP
jgi:penicillin-binding protein 2